MDPFDGDDDDDDNEDPLRSEDDPLVAYHDDPMTDEYHQPYTAYNQGFDAAGQDIPESLNPYPADSRENRWWRAGYEERQEQERSYDQGG